MGKRSSRFRFHYRGGIADSQLASPFIDFCKMINLVKSQRAKAALFDAVNSAALAHCIHHKDLMAN